MSFRLKRIIRCAFALNIYLCCLYFKRLLHFGSKLNYTGDNYCRAYVELCNLIIVVNFISLKNYLRAFEATSVVKVDKAELKKQKKNWK